MRNRKPQLSVVAFHLGTNARQDNDGRKQTGSSETQKGRETLCDAGGLEGNIYSDYVEKKKVSADVTSGDGIGEMRVYPQEETMGKEDTKL